MIRFSPVAVTGIGCLCAAGLNFSTCLDSLFEGSRHPVPPSSFRCTHPAIYPVFEVQDHFFHAEKFQYPDVLKTCRLSLSAALEAIEDSGWNREELQKYRVGVCIGSTVGTAMNNEQFYRKNSMGCDPDMSPTERYLITNPAAGIAREFSLSGPYQTVVNACTSGADAIGVAASWINAGYCDAVITGGADELCRVTYNGFISLKIYDESPCRPFDMNRKGLNLGEGAAVMMLESKETMRKRGRKPRANIHGFGTANDGYHLTAPKSDGTGMKTAIRRALAVTALSSNDIAFINAHGTGTPDNDLIESRIFQEIFPQVPFLSTKGFTGHAMGAVGAIEAAFTVGCLEMGVVPKSIGFDIPDPELPVYPLSKNTTIGGRFAISDSLGFGGNNSVLVIGLP